MKIWILTSEYNLYDQCGEYYIQAFKNLPTHEELTHYCQLEGEKFYQHMYKGGGRIDYEEVWYYLHEEDL